MYYCIVKLHLLNGLYTVSKHLNASTTRFLSGAAWVGKELQELAITKIQRLIKVVTDPYHQTAKH